MKSRCVSLCYPTRSITSTNARWVVVSRLSALKKDHVSIKEV